MGVVESRPAKRDYTPPPSFQETTPQERAAAYSAQMRERAVQQLLDSIAAGPPRVPAEPDLPHSNKKANGPVAFVYVERDGAEVLALRGPLESCQTSMDFLESATGEVVEVRRIYITEYNMKQVRPGVWADTLATFTGLRALTLNRVSITDEACAGMLSFALPSLKSLIFDTVDGLGEQTVEQLVAMVVWLEKLGLLGLDLCHGLLTELLRGAKRSTTLHTLQLNESEMDDTDLLLLGSIIRGHPALDKVVVGRVVDTGTGSPWEEDFLRAVAPPADHLSYLGTDDPRLARAMSRVLGPSDEEKGPSAGSFRSYTWARPGPG